MRPAYWWVLFAAAAVVLTGLYDWGLVTNCRHEGPTSSSVTLAMSSVLVARDRATSVEMCVVDGHCETRPFQPPPAFPTPGAFTRTKFTHVLPEGVTHQGSAGPPVKITVTLYDPGHTSVLTSSATLAPVTMNPGTGRRCHYAGYWVSAELRSDGALGYHQLA